MLRLLLAWKRKTKNGCVRAEDLSLYIQASDAKNNFSVGDDNA